MPDLNRENRYDNIIRAEVKEHFPELLNDLTEFGWLWVKAQMWQESKMDPAAESGCGAKGLMQLMPATDKGIDGDIDGTDPEGNIDNGVRYLAEQYRRFGEIPVYKERLKFALAAYNCGRAYVNKALAIAREWEGLPASFTRWERAGRPGGRWQVWSHAKQFLADPRCMFDGKSPDHRQVTDYVERIEQRYNHYLKEAAACQTIQRSYGTDCGQRICNQPCYASRLVCAHVAAAQGKNAHGEER